ADVPADRDRELARARRRHPTPARLEVDRVHPGGADPHLDLGRDRLRSLDLLEPQHLRPAELMLDDRLHEADLRTPLRSHPLKWLSRIAVDGRPLRESRDFRLLTMG